MAAGWTIDPGCFVWALVRGHRTGIDTIYLILPVPNGAPREDELKRMWGRASVAIARRTGQ
jgi:hypothetical protein